jgi:outer membrane immunogenic protein
MRSFRSELCIYILAGGAKHMRNLILGAAAAFGAVLTVMPAFADEAPAEPKHVRHVERAAPVRAAPVRSAPAQANPSWTGAQVGGQGGVSPMAQGFAEPGSHLFPSLCGSSSGLCSETPFSFSGTNTSATGGGFVGYRMQFGTMVVGLEGDANAKSASSSYTFSDSNSFRNETFTGSVKQGADGSIRGRLGFLVTPSVLVYGTGGVAFGSVSGSFGYAANSTSICCASVTGGGSWSTTRSGATGGGGVEAMITQQLALRLEYRYTDLGRFDETVPLTTHCGGVCSSPTSGASISLHPTFQAVRLGLGLSF